MTAEAVPDVPTGDAPSRTIDDEELDLGGPLARGAIWFFVFSPLVAFIFAVPMAFTWHLITWHDVVILAFFFWLTRVGVGVGFHRCFTHKSFKPNRPLKMALAIAGSLGLEGSIIQWVADHRKHHKKSDREGDPHSPWRYGKRFRDVVKGAIYAHIGWVTWGGKKNRGKKTFYAPDLLKDRDMLFVDRNFKWFVVASVLLPGIIGGLWGWSMHDAYTALFWGTAVRIGLMHNITFSINSVCHTVGKRSFKSRDMSRNVWWLAIFSGGESWHNLHHSDPTCARHGVDKGQLDEHARIIRWCEQAGWATDVKWPNKERIEKKRLAA
jgi:stearoyl-CoA desaturase (delta-9 desaturase)